MIITETLHEGKQVAATNASRKTQSTSEKIEERKVKERRYTLLPKLYKRVMLLSNQFPKMDATVGVLLEEINKRSLALLNGEEVGKDKDVGLKDLMNFYVRYAQVSNATFEIVRKFLIYFPIELDDERRRLLMFYDMLSPPSRARMFKLVQKIATGEEPFPRSGCNREKRLIQEVHHGEE